MWLVAIDTYPEVVKKMYFLFESTTTGNITKSR